MLSKYIFWVKDTLYKVCWVCPLDNSTSLPRSVDPYHIQVWISPGASSTKSQNHFNFLLLVYLHLDTRDSSRRDLWIQSKNLRFLEGLFRNFLLLQGKSVWSRQMDRILLLTLCSPTWNHHCKPNCFLYRKKHDTLWNHTLLFLHYKLEKLFYRKQNQL